MYFALTYGSTVSHCIYYKKKKRFLLRTSAGKNTNINGMNHHFDAMI
jgi:hypothetical protein